MRIAILTEAFSKDMGYAENLLPKALAKLGNEVHVISTDLPPYYYLKDFQQTYQSFTGKVLPPGEDGDGFKIHYLHHQRLLGYIRMRGYHQMMKRLRPQVVQTFAAISWVPLEAALARFTVGYRLFTGCHTHASVFPLALRKPGFWDAERLKAKALRSFHGRLISLVTEKCYAITQDCAEVAVNYFGVQRRKVVISSLGVDTDIFFPAGTRADLEDRENMRRELGVGRSDIVCIYTGRFSQDKNPLVLARAVERLRKYGLPYRGLFIGNGVQAEAIRNCQGCQLRDFVPFIKLPRFFRAADIGVWPTQESISMLDAAASGLPIVVNDTLTEVERVDGNGLQYRLNDLEDLVQALKKLRDSWIRQKMGRLGAQKMAEKFSWYSIARRRLSDYQAALERP